jgi:hypothetical protein
MVRSRKPYRFRNVEDTRPVSHTGFIGRAAPQFSPNNSGIYCWVVWWDHMGEWDIDAVFLNEELAHKYIRGKRDRELIHRRYQEKLEYNVQKMELQS